jgi:hypothetical protein
MTDPLGDQAGLYGPFQQSVTLDANGNGTVRFQAQGQKIQIISTRVTCSTNVKEATATIYKGNIGQSYEIEGSMAGSTGDTSNTNFYLNDGDSLYVVWVGGDIGATATAIISGWASVPGRGFRAVH